MKFLECVESPGLGEGDCSWHTDVPNVRANRERCSVWRRPAKD